MPDRSRRPDRAHDAVRLSIRSLLPESGRRVDAKTAPCGDTARGEAGQSDQRDDSGDDYRIVSLNLEQQAGDGAANRERAAGSGDGAVRDRSFPV